MSFIIQIAVGCFISQLAMGMVYIVLEHLNHMGCDHE
jgi:hypothetical protein